MSEQQGTAPAFTPQGQPTAIIKCREFPQKHLEVAPETLRVNQDLNETANWQCEDGKPFTIVFTGDTPFDGWVYNQNTGKNVNPRRDAAHKKPFKYLVAIDGYPPLDPDLIVDP